MATRIERILASHNTVLFMKGVLPLLLLHSKLRVARPLVQQELACSLLRSPCVTPHASGLVPTFQETACMQAHLHSRAADSVRR